MKKIEIKNKQEGPGIRYIGWSGRGWADGGPLSAGPLSSQAPLWDRLSQEIGINMVRVGFTMKHFVPTDLSQSFSFPESIKQGMENTEVSWAKSRDTAYAYAVKRCQELGWKVLICVNPSLNDDWEPHRLTASSPFLGLWESFCFHLAGYIHENWPGMAQFFEITNEPDIGYFDGDTSLPDYKGIRRGISPFQYRLLLEKAYQGIKRAVPEAKVIGPGLARWNQKWVKKVLNKDSLYLDGLSYHNVGGNLKDARTLKKAKTLLSDYLSLSSNMVFNSEWAWWPHHDTDDLETALRVSQILYRQAVGGAYASLYLGPAQPKDFSKGLGVLKFDPNEPDSAEKTRTFHAFKLMTRGVLKGKRLQVKNPFNKLKVLVLCRDNQDLVITLLNPSPKEFKDVCLNLDKSFDLKKDSLLKVYKFDHNQVDYLKQSDCNILKKFSVGSKSIIQFVWE
ncbi:MAG: hypothetical protein ACOC5G_03195 [Acidobacteriota bacterium]